MTFRTRVLLAVSAAALTPLLLVAVGVRTEAASRVRASVVVELEADLAALRGALEKEGVDVERRMDAVRAALDGDPEVREALLGGESTRLALLDAAPRLMALAGFDLLRIQEPGGKILASGHFRNEFDRVEPVPGPGITTLLDAPGAGGPLRVRVRAREVRLGGRDLVLVAGTASDLPGDVQVVTSGTPGPAGTLVSPSPGGNAGEAVPPSPELTRTSTLAWLDTTRDPPLRGEARLELWAPPDAGAGLQRTVDRWLLLGVGTVALSTLLLAAWLTSRLVRPLEGLAGTAGRIDLNRPDVRFPAGTRRDEIGALARVLGRMTDRLRSDAALLRETERRATVSDVARQVHHDIRNGLIPLRNVLRHLTDVRRNAPGTLPEVYGQREGTLVASLDYLDGLASGWARLGGGYSGGDEVIDVVSVAQAVVGAAVPPPEVTVRVRAGGTVPGVQGNPLALRRILENLVRNALDAVGGGPGEVTVAVEGVDGSLPSGGQGGREVRVVVSDTGPGLPPDGEERVFQDFYTTKAGGTGLGLSIVRRLTMDLGGSIEAGPAPGGGALFTLRFPPGSPRPEPADPALDRASR